MTPAEFLDEAARRLAGAGYAVERVALPGGPAVVGRLKRFRVRWFLTQLKVTVVVAAVDHVTRTGWERFGADAFQAAKAFPGGLPTGFQSGVGAVPVLAGVTVDGDAADAARAKPSPEWFTGIAMPALVDLTTGQVHHHEGRVMVGAVYVPFLRAQSALVTDVVARA